MARAGSALRESAGPAKESHVSHDEGMGAECRTTVNAIRQRWTNTSAAKAIRARVNDSYAHLKPGPNGDFSLGSGTFPLVESHKLGGFDVYSRLRRCYEQL